MEIERKFLVPDPPDLDAEGEPIEQGYLSVGDDEVRLRRRGGEHVITVKRGTGRSREEIEVSLERGQFEALWPKTEGKRLHKRRYSIPSGELEIELDLYEGELDGLAVAEVEFGSERDADRFEPPDWFGEEVTEDPAYKNQALAVAGRPA